MKFEMSPMTSCIIGTISLTGVYSTLLMAGAKFILTVI
jgi:hypothetical protein